MTDTIDMQDREAFVIYSPNRGFIKNKNKDYTENFAHARLFGMQKDAADSIKKGNLKSAVVIPVSMTLDPRKIFTAVLKGA